LIQNQLFGAAIVALPKGSEELICGKREAANRVDFIDENY
jgi:hypothetical protein